jgi:hypothetical protein
MTKGRKEKRRKREAPALTSQQVRRDEGGEQREGETERGRTSIEMRNDEGDETALRPRWGSHSEWPLRGRLWRTRREAGPIELKALAP